MDDDPNIYRNPKRVNHPILIFIFPAVQIMPAFVLLTAGMLLDASMKGFIAALIWFVICHYVLADDSVKDFIHKLWGLGLLDMAVKRTRTVVNPLKKRYFS